MANNDNVISFPAESAADAVYGYGAQIAGHLVDSKAGDCSTHRPTEMKVRMIALGGEIALCVDPLCLHLDSARAFGMAMCLLALLDPTEMTRTFNADDLKIFELLLKVARDYSNLAPSES